MSSERRGLTRREAMAAGAGVLGASASALAARPETAPKIARGRSLRFAHMTDAHVFDERGAPEGLAQCLRHAHEHDDRPELIVFGGDNLMNVDGSGSESADRQLAVWRSVLRDGCEIEAQTVIGNHDILELDPEDGKRWAVDAFGLERRYYSFDRVGWRFVCLDSTSPEGGGYKGRLDEAQFEWLDETLAGTPKGTHVCVVSHIPIIAPCAFFDGNNETSGDWVVPGAWMHIDARRIKDLFHRRGNVRLCISGHMHLMDTASYLGTGYACNGAVSGGWWEGRYHEFGPAYAMIDLFDDGTSSITPVDFGWVTRE